MDGLLGERKKWNKGEETTDLESDKRNLEKRQCLPRYKGRRQGNVRQEKTVQSLGAGYLAKLDLIPDLPQGLDQPALLPVALCATKRGLLFM